MRSRAHRVKTQGWEGGAVVEASILFTLTFLATRHGRSRRTRAQHAHKANVFRLVRSNTAELKSRRIRGHDGREFTGFASDAASRLCLVRSQSLGGFPRHAGERRKRRRRECPDHVTYSKHELKMHLVSHPGGRPGEQVPTGACPIGVPPLPVHPPPPPPLSRERPPGARLDTARPRLTAPSHRRETHFSSLGIWRRVRKNVPRFESLGSRIT